MDHQGCNYSQLTKTLIGKNYYELKAVLKNEIRILCEKIKYLDELIDDLMEDTEKEIQKKYLQGEIKKHRLDLLKIEVQEQYQAIENNSTKNT